MIKNTTGMLLNVSLYLLFANSMLDSRIAFWILAVGARTVLVASQIFSLQGPDIVSSLQLANLQLILYLSHLH